jgi:HSP20 family protein
MRWDSLHDFVAWHHRAHQPQAPESSGWLPPVDLYETADAYIITIELAGFTPEDFDVQATDEQLTVTGRRNLPASAAGGQFLHVERGQGAFSRRFAFPLRVSVTDVKADLKDGLLTVRVPKLARANGPLRVDVGA